MIPELALRSLVLLSVAAGCARLCGRFPALRHQVWNVSLVGLLLLPATTALLPGVRLGILPASPESGVRVAGENRPASLPGLAGPGKTLSPHGSGPKGDAEASSSPFGPFAILWSLGAVALLGRLSRERLRLAHLRRRSARAPAWLIRDVSSLAGTMGVHRRLQVLESAAVDVPATWGLLRPILVVPSGFHRWGPGRRRRILLHELAHIRRHDATWALIAQMATAVFWWNPLAWYAARAARDASEAAADAHVLGSGARPTDYAEDLLGVARQSIRAPWLLRLPGIGRGRLRDRIEAVLEPHSLPIPARRVAAATGALTILLVGMVATVVPVRASRSIEVPVARAFGSADEVAGPPWPAHQVRWAHGGEAGALFLEGDVDLAALVRKGRLPASSGLLVWFHREKSGAWTSFVAGRNTGGRPRGRVPDRGALALRQSLIAVAPDWREHPETSIGSLSTLPGVVERRPLDTSGSVIVGVPGKSRDPGSGVLQAGWYSGEERIGVFARGPLDLDGNGRSLGRLSDDGWFAAFGWTPGTGRIRIVEALPGPAGNPTVRYTEDGIVAPLDAAAAEWLGQILADLPGLESGAMRASWRG